MLPAESFLVKIGPETLNPKRLKPNLSKPTASSPLLNPEETNSTPPNQSFEAPLVVMFTIPPVASPNWAGIPPVITLTCSIADLVDSEFP